MTHRTLVSIWVFLFIHVTFKENAGLGDSILAKFLGVSYKIGNSVCYVVLKANSKVLSRSTI